MPYHIQVRDSITWVQAVRRSKEAFKLQEDAQYGSSILLPKEKVCHHLHCVR